MKHNPIFFSPGPDDGGSNSTVDDSAIQSENTSFDNTSSGSDQSTDSSSGSLSGSDQSTDISSSSSSGSDQSTDTSSGSSAVADQSIDTASSDTGTLVKKDADGLKLLGAGSWNGSTTVRYQGGMGMHLQLKNVNVLGTTITINSNRAGSKSLLILPQQTVSLNFDCFGAEPQGWTFDISTDGDAFIIAWSLYSTWIPGDPPNG